MTACDNEDFDESMYTSKSFWQKVSGLALSCMTLNIRNRCWWEYAITTCSQTCCIPSQCWPLVTVQQALPWLEVAPIYQASLPTAVTCSRCVICTLSLAKQFLLQSWLTALPVWLCFQEHLHSTQTVPRRQSQPSLYAGAKACGESQSVVHCRLQCSDLALIWVKSLAYANECEDRTPKADCMRKKSNQILFSPHGMLWVVSWDKPCPSKLPWKFARIQIAPTYESQILCMTCLFCVHYGHVTILEENNGPVQGLGSSVPTPSKLKEFFYGALCSVHSFRFCYAIGKFVVEQNINVECSRVLRCPVRFHLFSNWTAHDSWNSELSFRVTLWSQ